MATPDLQQYLDIRELSDRIGLSVTTLRRYAREGKIDALQPGGRGGKLLFRPDVLDHLASHCKSGNSKPVNSSIGVNAGRLSGRRPTWMTVPTSSPETQPEGE